VAFNQGCEAQVINISRGGILLDTEVRLRPQMKILLKLITSEGVIKMDGQILRSSISSLNGVPRYRSAIAFDHPFHMLDDLSADLEEEREESPEAPAGTDAADTVPDQPLMGLVAGSTMDGDSAILTVIAKDGMSAQEVFELNDW